MTAASKNNKSRKFCCMRCYNEHKKINQIKMVCGFCGRDFFVSKKRSQEVSHCSRKCYIDHAASGGTRVCKNCGLPKPDEEFAKHAKDKQIKRRVCIDCFNLQTKEKNRRPLTRWLGQKSRCDKSEQTWKISFAVFESLIVMPCHYCGGKLNLTGCGLDRKDNSKGYEVDNVVPCCRQCNRVKGHDFTYDEMLLISPVLQGIREARIAHGK